MIVDQVEVRVFGEASDGAPLRRPHRCERFLSAGTEEARDAEQRARPGATKSGSIVRKHLNVARFDDVKRLALVTDRAERLSRLHLHRV